MRRRSLALLMLPALFASACTTGGARRGPVEVIRYNLGTPIAVGSFAIDRDAARGTTGLSSDYEMVVGAVGDEMTRLGFTRVADGAPSIYLVEISVNRAQVGETRTGPRFGIDLGGGTGGFRGGGVGGGVSTAFGGSTRAVIGNDLTVKIRRRTDQTVVWEGNARSSGTAPANADDAAFEAGRVANALFRDFPGQSGFTTTVP